MPCARPPRPFSTRLSNPPIRSSRSPLLGLLLLPVFLLAGCGDSTPTAPEVIAELELTGPEVMVEGETVQADLVALDEAGNVVPDVFAEWESSDSDVVEVDPAGLLTAQGIGTALITATVDDLTSSFEVEVVEDPCATPVGDLKPGESVTGELTEESCFLEEWFYDPWLLEVEAPVEVRIEVESEDFIPYLLLTDQLLNQLGENEATEPGEPAVLEGTLPAGNLLIWVSTSGTEEVGAYELSVADLGAP